jgi:hypothetical protein
MLIASQDIQGMIQDPLDRLPIRTPNQNGAACFPAHTGAASVI